MNSKPLWLLNQWLKRIWVRVVAFAALAILAVGLAHVLAPAVPSGVGEHLGTSAVEEILAILASSMLAVTTFSLSIAVSAFAAAAQSATPRATALLQEDGTTQNVLATFLGAFLFSLLGLIALRTDLYDRDGEVVLFLATLGIVGLVIVALLRWIVHLMSFGRMHNTLDRVEAAASEALERRLETPFLGGNPLQVAAPDGALAVRASQTGYVQHVDVHALEAAAASLDARVFVAALPGAFVHPAAALVHVHGADLDGDAADGLRRAFTLGRERTFSQDPRFGLVVLAEIASRALSPAVNDPGTAISVLGRLVRVLSAWRERDDAQVAHARVYVPAIRPDEMLEDAFRPIARDGAGVLEVQLRLHKALDALGGIAPQVFARVAADMAERALAHSRRGGLLPEDVALLEAAAEPTLARRAYAPTPGVAGT